MLSRRRRRRTACRLQPLQRRACCEFWTTTTGSSLVHRELYCVPARARHSQTRGRRSAEVNQPSAAGPPARLLQRRPLAFCAASCSASMPWPSRCSWRWPGCGSSRRISCGRPCRACGRLHAPLTCAQGGGPCGRQVARSRRRGLRGGASPRGCA